MRNIQDILNDPNSKENNKREATWECVAGRPGGYHDIPFIHEGHGIIEPIAGGSRYYRRFCPCEHAAKKRYEEYMRRQTWEAETVAQTYGWLGKRYHDHALVEKTFETFQAYLQQDAFVTVAAWVEHRKGTLLLHGPYGTGKTHLLAALCNVLRTEHQVASLFVTAPKLFAAIQDRIFKGQEHSALLDKAVKTPLLVIDDIDKAKPSEYRQEVYFHIMDERSKNGLPIAISTNRKNELADFIGGACVSRLSIGQIAVEMTSGDYRKNL